MFGVEDVNNEIFNILWEMEIIPKMLMINNKINIKTLKFIETKKNTGDRCTILSHIYFIKQCNRYCDGYIENSDCINTNIKNNNIKIIQSLICHQFRFDEKHLETAVQSNNLEMVKLLVNNGVIMSIDLFKKSNREIYNYMILSKKGLSKKAYNYVTCNLPRPDCIYINSRKY